MCLFLRKCCNIVDCDRSGSKRENEACVEGFEARYMCGDDSVVDELSRGCNEGDIEDDCVDIWWQGLEEDGGCGLHRKADGDAVERKLRRCQSGSEGNARRSRRKHENHLCASGVKVTNAGFERGFEGSESHCHAIPHFNRSEYNRDCRPDTVTAVHTAQPRIFGLLARLVRAGERTGVRHNHRAA
ncbi:hypothetical protein BC830DRAFT_597685 [Chytriomyces sp. MP71]|nr:hypothetical protein BC830DRAFT_597685 [Chytriomyces sp. MP71]